MKIEITAEQCQHGLLPYAANTVTEVAFVNLFQQVRDVIPFMEELHRVCANDALVQIACPYYTSASASSNPLNVRSVSEGTFAFFDAEFRKTNNLPPLSINFRPVRVAYRFNDPWTRKSDEAREYAKLHYWNVIEEVMVEMKAVK